MKFDEIIAKIAESVEPVNEVRMGASDLDQFVNSPLAAGIKAGFEAELCFRGIGGSSEPDYDNPEEDMEPDTRASSIDEICDFFEDGEYNGRGDVRRLRERLEEEYLEWRSDKLSENWSESEYDAVDYYIGENEFDRDEVIEQYLEDELDLSKEQVEAAMEVGKEYKKFTRAGQRQSAKEGNEAFAHYAEAADHADTILAELVKESIDRQDRNWERAKEEWEEKAIDDDDDYYGEWNWLDDNYRYMSDISGNFGITWPYWTYPESDSEGGYSQESASNLARSLQNTLGLSSVSASGGYHSTSRNAERWIIEPDGSLEADDGDDMPAEIVSPPMELKECLDKITEFFDWAQSEDAYTNESTGLHVGVSLPDVGGKVDYLKLALFLGDQYVLEKFDRMGNHYCRSALSKIESQALGDPAKIQSAFEKIKGGLIELANDIVTGGVGHGKYTSINLKGDYIEFRSMGGDYINRINEIKQMIKRYAYAMTIAANPGAYRQEYAKKLYKLLSTSGNQSTIQLFSRFSSGTLSKEELKNELRAIRASKIEKSKSGDGGQTQGAQSQQLGAGHAAGGEPRPAGGGAFTGQWRIVNAADVEVHRFGGIGNSQGDANRVASQWLRQQGLTNLSGFDVLPVMG